MSHLVKCLFSRTADRNGERLRNALRDTQLFPDRFSSCFLLLFTIFSSPNYVPTVLTRVVCYLLLFTTFADAMSRLFQLVFSVVIYYVCHNPSFVILVYF